MPACTAGFPARPHKKSASALSLQRRAFFPPFGGCACFACAMCPVQIFCLFFCAIPRRAVRLHTPTNIPRVFFAIARLCSFVHKRVFLELGNGKSALRQDRERFIDLRFLIAGISRFAPPRECARHPDDCVKPGVFQLRGKRFGVFALCFFHMGVSFCTSPVPRQSGGGCPRSAGNVSLRAAAGMCASLTDRIGFFRPAPR